MIRVESGIFRDGQRYHVKLKVAGTPVCFPCGVGQAGLQKARQRRDEMLASATRHAAELRPSELPAGGAAA